MAARGQQGSRAAGRPPSGQEVQLRHQSVLRAAGELRVPPRECSPGRTVPSPCWACQALCWAGQSRCAQRGSGPPMTCVHQGLQIRRGFGPLHEDGSAKGPTSQGRAWPAPPAPAARPRTRGPGAMLPRPSANRGRRQVSRSWRASASGLQGVTLRLTSATFSWALGQAPCAGLQCIHGYSAAPAGAGQHQGLQLRLRGRGWGWVGAEGGASVSQMDPCRYPHLPQFLHLDTPTSCQLTSSALGWSLAA